MWNEALQELSLAAARSNNREQLITQVMPLLKRRLNANISLFYERRGEMVFGQTEDLSADLFQAYKPFVAADPLHVIKVERDVRLAVTTDLLPPDEYLNSAVFNDFFEPHNIGHQLALRPTPTGFDSDFAAIMLCRPMADPFSAEDLEFSQGALAVLEATLWRVQQFALQGIVNASLGEIATKHSGLYAVFSREGALLWAAKEAERDRDRLGAVWGEELRYRALHFASFGSQTVLAVSGNGRRTLAIGATADGHVYFSAKRPVQVSKEVVERYALSAAERAVLAQLQLGKSNAEIASELYVSTNTVRTHVQNLLRKMRVGSRLEAVARLNGRE